MDISAAAGRHEFVRLLVYWSFSEEHRLGYDPTVRRLSELSCWEIEVPVYVESKNDATAETGMPLTKTYYSNLMVTVPERLFGRHTRCFLATPDKPSDSRELEIDDYTVFIKDAWPEADDDSDKDMRDEIKHSIKIKRKLGKSRQDLDGMYPVIEAGGRIHIAKHARSSEIAEDTTRAILGNSILLQSKAAELRETEADRESADTEPAVHVRVHKRIATTPIGLPISKANSVYDMLVIFADVMRCHYAIYKECKILHRDISIGNIMFRRTDEGVSGLLIDFDHSKDEEEDGGATHDMRTGTLPFMSINSLENNHTKRNVLDDWESLIYILCWIGTYGYNSKTRREFENGESLMIRQWVADDMKCDAKNKRNSLHSSETFASKEF
ncbi:hypothetical protein FB639_003639 [Coemansia asiatica]|nr:hypothetical protein FB639_003639 [Coemansia asiatica]